jgi:hypothetical protein
MQADAVATLPPDTDNTNFRRAQWADDALSAFERQHSEEGERLQNLADLLSAFGHWCVYNGFRLAEALEMAGTKYSGETNRQGLQFGAGGVRPKVIQLRETKQRKVLTWRQS